MAPVNNVEFGQNYAPGNVKVVSTSGNILIISMLMDMRGNSLKSNAIIAGQQYVFYYSTDNPKYPSALTFLGRSQIHAMAKLVMESPTEAEILAEFEEENCYNIKYIEIPESPYCIEKIGRRNKVMSGSGCELIGTDLLCRERAEYENWKATRLTDTISINVLFAPWLDVNKKVNYMPQQSITGEISQYIIKRISGSLTDGTCTIDMIKFYPTYPYIVEK